LDAGVNALCRLPDLRQAAAMSKQPAAALAGFLAAHPRLFVLTGAGISVGSGIPEYRDKDGEWKRPAPIQYRDFIDHLHARQRYWARSLIGWRWFGRASPNVCHRTLAHWETQGRIAHLVTQNVDRLHQAAGARQVIDLHGRLDRIRCLDCGAVSDRAPFQQTLEALNPDFGRLTAAVGPDGDAALQGIDFAAFQVPSCRHCGGLLKPDVVFFGETIPRERVERALTAMCEADALLVIGSSLMVYSGFRFCRLASERRLPMAAITPGRTRADGLLDLKISARFEDVIATLERPWGEPPGAGAAMNGC
jgi:NAD-dependent SIR2 family protein deacetylase